MILAVASVSPHTAWPGAGGVVTDDENKMRRGWDGEDRDEGGYTREWDVGGWAACIRELSNVFTQNPHTRTLTQIFYLHAWTSKFHTWVTINTYTPLIMFVYIYPHTHTRTHLHTHICTHRCVLALTCTHAHTQGQANGIYNELFTLQWPELRLPAGAVVSPVPAILAIYSGFCPC